MTEADDLILVAKAQAGDTESMECLIAKFMWLARSKARKYFLVNGSYDDLLQEGLMGIFKAIRDYDFEKNNNLTIFISLCINTKMMDAIRTSSRDKHKFLNEAVSIASLDDNIPHEYISDPIYTYIEREGVNGFYQKLEALFLPEQLQVLKYYMEGYTYLEIAKKMDLPIKRIDNLLHNIKTKIKKNRELFLST